MSRYLDELLPTDIYNVNTIQQFKMKEDCSHNYNRKSIKKEDSFARATCTKCGGYVTIDVYE